MAFRHAAPRPARTNTMARRTTRGSLRRPLTALAAVAALGGVLAFAAPAFADEQLDVGYAASALWPSAITVGQTVAVRLQIINTSQGVQAGGTSNLIPPIDIWGSCSDPLQVVSCPAADADPTAYSYSATGAGVAGTACAGITFTISAPDPSTGLVTLTPSSTVTLAAPGAGSTAECEVDFSITARHVPSKPIPGSAPASSHIETAVAQFNGVPAQGGGGQSTGNTTFLLATPAVATQASPTVTLGHSISDTATLSGGVGATGSITFKAYGPNDSSCSLPPVSTSTVNITGNGSYSSTPFTPTAAGTYRFIATYSGDANNNSVSNSCSDAGEAVIVVATPALSTQASGTVTLGNPISDTATLTGGVGATGSITFRAYGPNDGSCSSAPVSTFTMTVTGNGNYASSAFTPTVAGTYRFIATYSGDANNLSVANSCSDAGEAVIVSPPPNINVPPVPVTPTLTTTASAAVTLGNAISDGATLAGGSSPTGTITFRAYGPNDTSCSSAPVATSTATVAGDGGYRSAGFTPSSAGTYRFIATYSGDNNNNSVSTSCTDAGESVAVTPPGSPPPPPPPLIPTALVTKASASVTLGKAISDTATLSGGVNPTGTITFKAYGPNDATCAKAPANSSSVTVSRNGDYTSPAFTPKTAGTYRFVASYSGDAANGSAATACSDAGESVIVRPPAHKGNVPNVVPPPPINRAVIHGPGAGCVPKTFQAYVTGNGIKKVTFYEDTNKLGTVTKADSKGRYTITVDSSKLKSGEYRVVARVMFNSAKGKAPLTQPATLLFYTCPKSPKPQFTG